MAGAYGLWTHEGSFLELSTPYICNWGLMVVRTGKREAALTFMRVLSTTIAPPGTIRFRSMSCASSSKQKLSVTPQSA